MGWYEDRIAYYTTRIQSAGGTVDGNANLEDLIEQYEGFGPSKGQDKGGNSGGGGGGGGASVHSALTGLGADDHPHYFNQTRADARYVQPTDAVITGKATTGHTHPAGDHNAQTNLTAGDAHTQYLNNTRGDARYNTKTEITTLLGEKSDTDHTHSGSFDPALFPSYRTWNGTVWSARLTPCKFAIAYSDGTGGSTRDINATAPTGDVNGDVWMKAST